MMQSTVDAQTIPLISWADFRARFRWSQGEHVAAIAPTGAGKTTLFKSLIPYRKHNLFFGTKVDDSAYRDLIRKQGFRRVESIADARPWDNNILLWPKQRKNINETIFSQRAAFQDALNTVVKQGAWAVWVDEAKYLSEFLHLKTELTFALEQLRSINATVISGAQRPSYIPPSVLSNSTHVFLWKTTHDEDAKRLADVGGIDSKVVAQAAKTLDRHEFIYIQSRGTQGQIFRTQINER